MRKKHSTEWMMRAVVGFMILAAGLTVAAVAAAWGADPGGAGEQAPAKLLSELKGPFDLAAQRTPQVQYFRMETRFIHIGFDGKLEVRRSDYGDTELEELADGILRAVLDKKRLLMK